MKVFLGGTCNNSKWRDDLIKGLSIDYFNPVVKDWTPTCQAEEIYQRKVCDFCLYVITPKMTGVYSIAEVVEDSIKQSEKVIFCILPTDEEDLFNQGQMRSLLAVAKMVERNTNRLTFTDINSVRSWLNSQAITK